MQLWVQGGWKPRRRLLSCLLVGGVSPALAPPGWMRQVCFSRETRPSSAGESGWVFGPDSCYCTETAFLKSRFFLGPHQWDWPAQRLGPLCHTAAAISRQGHLASWHSVQLSSTLVSPLHGAQPFPHWPGVLWLPQTSPSGLLHGRLGATRTPGTQPPYLTLAVAVSDGRCSQPHRGVRTGQTGTVLGTKQGCRSGGPGECEWAARPDVRWQ